MKRHAWMAFSFASAGLALGCSTQPDAVEPVPPPNYGYSAGGTSEPLPPVSVNEGSPIAAEAQPAGVALGPGPASFEPEPLAPAQPASRTYTIKKGDTLWSIARLEYGKGQRWKDIAQANPSVDPRRLMIGQQITLP